MFGTGRATGGGPLEDHGPGVFLEGGIMVRTQVISSSVFILLTCCASQRAEHDRTKDRADAILGNMGGVLEQASKDLGCEKFDHVTVQCDDVITVGGCGKTATYTKELPSRW